MSDQGEKQPIVLDIAREVSRDSLSIQVVFDRERVERLQLVASQLGGFSVAIVAESGEPYRTRYRTETGLSAVSPVMEVPKDKVIVRMVNISRPQTPTDLSRLFEAVREE